MSKNKEGKKHQSTKRRGVLKSQSREMIVNVRTYFEGEKLNGGPLIPVDQVNARTAAACQISEKLISNILNEKSTNTGADTKLISTEKKGPCESSLDFCQENAIRRHLYSYYEREEYPTMRRLVASLNQAGLFSGSTTTLCYILKKIGFSWKKILGNRKLLMERVDIIAWRGRFIRELFSAPVERIIWLDETCVDSDHFKKQKSDEINQVSKNASKGFRLIVLHAGGTEGFVPNAKLIFRGKKNSSDYHSEISQFTFKQWFTEQLIPNVKPERIIVMDDAPYHCVNCEKYPTIAQTKKEIMAWLESKNIKFDPKMLRIELLEIVKQQKPRFPIYEIDEIAKERGHRVLRIPPCHSHFNPIETIWNQIKSYVTKNSRMFKISEATKLTEKKIDNICSQDWKIAVKHTMDAIKIQAQLDKIVEERVDNMIHAPKSTSESEESDYTDEEFSDDNMEAEEDFPPLEGGPSDVLRKTTVPRDICSINEERSINIGNPSKQELVEEMEINEEKDRDKETSILYRRLSDSLHAKQRTFPTTNSISDTGDWGTEITKPCKQELFDCNVENVKKEHKS